MAAFRSGGEEHGGCAIAIRRFGIGAGVNKEVGGFEIVQRAAQWSAVVPSAEERLRRRGVG